MRTKKPVKSNIDFYRFFCTVGARHALPLHILPDNHRLAAEGAAIGDDVDARRDGQARRARRDGRLADEDAGEVIDVHGGCV
ncbi:MAG: hypothetical protein LBL07_01250, partial [Tannerella sp.]|nr:hypothetical protein [Tannerella sp.]